MQKTTDVDKCLVASGLPHSLAGTLINSQNDPKAFLTGVEVISANELNDLSNHFGCAMDKVHQCANSNLAQVGDS